MTGGSRYGLCRQLESVVISVHPVWVSAYFGRCGSNVALVKRSLLPLFSG